VGGDLWGANGGGITPVGGGVTGQAGWDERVGATVSDGQTAGNFQLNSTQRGQPMIPLQQQTSNAALSCGSFDDALPTGGSNQG
jgi:hypothetical protein